MAKRTALRLDDQLCFALYNASRALTRAYAPLLEPLGVTYPQYLALLVLWEEDGVSVKALGDKLCLDSGTLTPLLKRMESAGLVKRSRSDDDERVVLVSLTQKAKQLQTQAQKVPMALAAAAGFDVKKEEELVELLQLKQKLEALTQKLAG